jgi:hypothetical protein
MQLKMVFLVLPIFVSAAFAQWHPQKSDHRRLPARIEHRQR